MAQHPDKITVNIHVTVEGSETVDNADPDFRATAFCPVCCSTIDVEGTGLQRLECSHCGQVQWLIIDAERFHAHSAV